MSAPTLFEIVTDLQALDDLLGREDEGDLADADVVAQWLEELEGKLEDKVERTAAVIRTLDERCGAREAEAARLQALAKTDAAASARLKERTIALLEAAGRTSVDTPHYRVSVTGNGGRLPLIVDEGADFDKLSLRERERFTQHRRVLDTYAVRRALTAGESLPFARLGERGRHLRIR